MKQQHTPGQPILKISSVSKSYPQASSVVRALHDINLDIAFQDIYGIIGLSGAGKSTLIRCLAGLIKPTTGSIVFHHQNIGCLKGAELRSFYSRIGMIFQHFNLFSSKTVARNITYPLEIAGVSLDKQNKRVEELLELVGLSHRKNAYPSSLSGGEKQRVGIARALAHSPEILFCDEATSALDPKTTKEILDLLKTINKTLGLTIVLITHDMEVIKRICNKVAVIDSGTVVEAGLVSQVFAEPEHSITKYFIQSSSHEIPEEFFKPLSANRKLLRLKFKGSSANEPLISQIVKKYHVDANILLGWIDHLQTTTVGTLIVEISGSPEGISGALEHLSEKMVHYDILERYGH